MWTTSPRMQFLVCVSMTSSFSVYNVMASRPFLYIEIRLWRCSQKPTILLIWLFRSTSIPLWLNLFWPTKAVKYESVLLCMAPTSCTILVIHVVMHTLFWAAAETELPLLQKSRRGQQFNFVELLAHNQLLSYRLGLTFLKKTLFHFTSFVPGVVLPAPSTFHLCSWENELKVCNLIITSSSTATSQS